MIAETASSDKGGSKAAWIKDMLAKIPVNYPQVRGLLWFEKFDDGMDWPIETSSSSAAAFAEGIQSPSYLGNTFASTGPGTIQPSA